MKASILAASLVAAAAATSLPATARAGTCSLTGQIVTYYSQPDQSIFSSDPRCSYVVNPAGTPVCRIALKGILYRSTAISPLGGLPAIVYNHGSEHTFDAETKACAIAEFFVPMGYHVFVPFRRGQGEIPESCLAPEPTDPCEDRDHARLSTLSCPLGPNESTGKYISQALDEYTATTTCSKSCRFVQLLDEQTSDVIEATKWLRARTDVADDKIAIMGNSYGGMMTVLTNAKGAFWPSTTVYHRAAVAFSPGAISWEGNNGPNTNLQNALKAAAASARRSTYYLQGRWDYDTRAGVEQAYAHAYGTSDDAHSPPFALQIFDTAVPPVDTCTGELDWQTVHSGFAKDTATWGPSVVDFLERNGVK